MRVSMKKVREIADNTLPSYGFERNLAADLIEAREVMKKIKELAERVMKMRSEMAGDCSNITWLVDEHFDQAEEDRDEECAI